MHRLLSRAGGSSSGAAAASTAMHIQRRYAFEEVTKGSPFMKHLDLYARRDPQLAPYLLREVDIEFKRKCRKVNFCFWTALATILLAYQYRLQAEELCYLKDYAELCRAEQDARDEDHVTRRRTFVLLTNAVKEAFNRDQKWTAEDKAKVTKILSCETPAT